MAAPKRRQYGSGSVYQRSADGRWVGIIQLGWTETGGRRTSTVIARTRAEVVRKLEQRKREIDTGGTSDVRSGTTVKSWSEDWLTQQTRQLRPSTVEGYSTAITKWIVPTIGHRRLTDLTPGDVRKVTDALRKAGRSTTTARLIQVNLTKMLRDAIAEGHNVPARVLTVKAPAKAVNDRGEIPLEQVSALLRAARDLPDGSRWSAALLQGLRQGEALGLTWECVDLDRGTIDVAWKLEVVPYAAGRSGPLRVPDGFECRTLHGNLCLTRPKSRAGQRIIPMTPGLHQALIERPKVHDLVWPALRSAGRKGNEVAWLPQRADADSQAWRDLQDRAQIACVDGTLGRRYLIHEARHSTATALMALGVDESVRIAILGHSSITTTRGYQHVGIEMARRALTRLEGAALELG